MAKSAAKLSQFLAETAQLAASLRQRIEAEVQGLSADREAQKVRQARVQADFGYFCQTYFPHYLLSPHRSALHHYLFKRLPEMVGSEKSENDAIAAPRGEAKSTIVSQLFVLWCCVTGRKFPEAISHYGQIESEWAAPWLHSARVAEALGTRMLQWRARPVWTIPFTLPFQNVVPGQQVAIQHPRRPRARRTTHAPLQRLRPLPPSQRRRRRRTGQKDLNH